MSDERETLGGDDPELMTEAREIAFFLYGKDDDETRRKIYDMKPEEQRALGIFRIGKQYAARKSTIKARIAKREAGEQS